MLLDENHVIRYTYTHTYIHDYYSDQATRKEKD